MEYRPLDITVISASELKNVNMFMKMDVYVVVSLSCENSTKRKTYTDRSGGANPEWNYRIKFSVEESSIYKDFIRFQLKAERSLGDKLIGEVSIPLGDLLDDYHGNNDSSHEHEVEYQVRTSSGKARGSFRFSYRFGEKFTQQMQAIAPVTNTTTTTTTQSIVEVYPPPPEHFSGEFYPHAAMGYTMQPVMVAPQYPVPPGYTYQGYGGYPPPPYQYGGGYPPAVVTGYAYPPQPMAYAYTSVQQLGQIEPKSIDNDKKKKSGFGKKLGFGIGGGMLGGLMMSEVGEMLSDVGNMETDDGDTEQEDDMDFVRDVEVEEIEAT